jgi:hypothetical protein
MFDLDRFIADCRAALATSSPPAAVGALVDRALAAPAEVEAAPGMAIYPHEHRMWAVIGLYGGREDNTFYRRDARGLAVAGGKRLERSETALLDEAIIHSVVNPLQGFTGAIHVYGGDFFWHASRSEWAPGTLESPFDVERAGRARMLGQRGAVVWTRRDPDDPEEAAMRIKTICFALPCVVALVRRPRPQRDKPRQVTFPTSCDAKVQAQFRSGAWRCSISLVHGGAQGLRGRGAARLELRDRVLGLAVNYLGELGAVAPSPKDVTAASEALERRGRSAPRPSASATGSRRSASITATPTRRRSTRGWPPTPRRWSR